MTESEEKLKLDIIKLESQIDNLKNRHDPEDPFGLKRVILAGDEPTLESHLMMTLRIGLAEKRNQLNELEEERRRKLESGITDVQQQIAIAEECSSNRNLPSIKQELEFLKKSNCTD